MDTVEKITKLFEESGKSASSILKELNFSPTALSEWKRGKAKPTADALAKLADYFGVSVDYLLGRTDAPNPPGQPSITNIDIPPVLQEVGVAFHGGPNSLSQEDVNEMAKFVEFLRAKKKEEDNKKGTP